MEKSLIFPKKRNKGIFCAHIPSLKITHSIYYALIIFSQGKFVGGDGEGGIGLGVGFRNSGNFT
jgi:hypothetical protein